MKQVISPHIDDAILSLGGCILNWVRNGEKVKIINVFSKASAINKDAISVRAGKKYPTDFKSAMNVKKAEEKRVQNALKIKAEFLDWPDRNLNIHKYKGYFFYKKSSIDRLKNHIRRKINKDSTIFFPLAMGEIRVHADHIIIRQIGLFLLKDGYDVRFYEDLPYCYFDNQRAKSPDFFQTIKKQDVSFLKEKHALRVDESLFGINDHFTEIKLVPVTEEIDVDEKVKLLGYYESQMEARWIEKVRRHAFSSEDNKYYETYWKPELPPSIIAQARQDKTGTLLSKGLRAVFIEHRLPWRLQNILDRLFPAPVEPYAAISFQPLIITLPHTIHMYEEYGTIWKEFLKVLKGKKVYFLCRVKHTIEPKGNYAYVKMRYPAHKKDHPTHEITYLANNLTELELLGKVNIPAIFCNQNAFIDEDIFRVIPGAEKRYNAVYNARFIECKRHYLITQIKDLALITYFTAEASEEEGRYLAELKTILPQAVMLNWKGHPSFKEINGREGWERMQYEKLPEYLNQAKVGLILSPEEGAVYAAAEYLLCGLPVVSTKSIGGRDVFFDDEYTRIVDETPEAVKEGVEELIRRNIPPEYVREKTLEKMKPHRERFIKLVQDIYDKENAHRNFADEFKETIILNKAFIHNKTLKRLDKRSVKRDLKIS